MHTMARTQITATQRRRGYAYHEAGHAVVAQLEVHPAAAMYGIHFTPDHHEVVGIPDTSGLLEDRAGMAAVLRVVVAGELAQRRVVPEPDGCVNDQAKTRELASALWEKPTQEDLQGLEGGVNRTLTTHWDIVAALAERLLAGGSLTGPQLQRFFAEHRLAPRR